MAEERPQEVQRTGRCRHLAQRTTDLDSRERRGASGDSRGEAVDADSLARVLVVEQPTDVSSNQPLEHFVHFLSPQRVFAPFLPLTPQSFATPTARYRASSPGPTPGRRD